MLRKGASERPDVSPKDFEHQVEDRRGRPCQAFEHFGFAVLEVHVEHTSFYERELPDLCKRSIGLAKDLETAYRAAALKQSVRLRPDLIKNDLTPSRELFWRKPVRYVGGGKLSGCHGCLFTGI